MSRRDPMFLRLLAVVGLIGVVGACTVGEQLEEQLEGEPCTVEKDCWSTQECARTVEEEFLGLPGLCEPEGTGCLVGQQLGCACDVMDPALNCSNPAYPLELQATYPKMICHPMLLICAVDPAPAGDQP